MNSIASKLFLLLFALASPLVLSQASDSLFETTVVVDWEQGLVTAVIAYDMAAAGLRLPAGRTLAERSIESMMMHLVRPAVHSIGVDSWRTIADCLDDRSLAPSDLELFLSTGQKKEARLSQDFRQLIINYEFQLHRLGALFIRHTSPMDQTSYQSFTPTRDYSGILVYAKGLYPIRGEHRTGHLVPSLFPRIYDENMTLLLERNLVSPSALLRWNSVGWASSLDSSAIEQRVGQDPLRIMAYSIFGTHRTDVILSATDAQKILGNDRNRQLIQEGRVVLVYDRQ